MWCEAAWDDAKGGCKRQARPYTPRAPPYTPLRPLTPPHIPSHPLRSPYNPLTISSHPRTISSSALHPMPRCLISSHTLEHTLRAPHCKRQASSG